MSTDADEPKPQAQFERLLAQADEPLSREAEDEAWRCIQQRLQAAPTGLKEKTEGRVPPRRWVWELLTGVAALLLLAVMLFPVRPDSRLASVDEAPERNSSPEIDTRRMAAGDGELETAADVALALEALSSNDFQTRRKAFLRLLRGNDIVRQAVRTFKPGADAEQSRAHKQLLRGYDMQDKLVAVPDVNSLAYWSLLWELEAQERPDIWNIGLRVNLKTQSLPPPTGLLGDVFESRGAAPEWQVAKKRFQEAYRILAEFRLWERAGGIEARAADTASQKRLEALAAAGVSVAPVVLHVLATDSPVNMIVQGEARELKDGEGAAPEPLDHLRMIVAADRLGLHEAELYLIRWAPKYPTSPTIQMHVISALWRLGGKSEGWALPFDFGIPEPHHPPEVISWWLERRVEVWRAKPNDAATARELRYLKAHLLPKAKALKVRQKPALAERLKKIVAEVEKLMPDNE